MTTHLIYIISLFIGLLPAKNSDCQEIFKSDNIIIGKWGNVDTGFAISTEFINKLYREDNNWSESGINSQKFYFVDSTITSEGSEFTIWATSSYTSRRLYLKNGGEESIETTEYKIFKFKLVNKDKLLISTSRSWYINKANIHPGVLLPYQIKNTFIEPPSFGKSIIFKRLKK